MGFWDLKQQKLHGIFISHKSNITYKEPFQIDIIDNLIHIYLPNTEYNIEKIKIAVEIIDTLSTKLIHISDVQAETTTINITKEDIESSMMSLNEVIEYTLKYTKTQLELDRDAYEKELEKKKKGLYN